MIYLKNIMSIKKTKKLTFLKFQLGSAILTLTVLLISGFFIFGPSLEQVARAVTGNYSKTTGDSLDITDWNNLDNDFVDKNGDTMTGPLTLPADPTLDMQAATKQYVDNNVGGGVVVSDIKNTLGTELRMVCGETTPADWTLYDIDVLRVDINTSAAGFTATPSYFVSIYGTAGHWRTMGINSLYFSSPTGFTIFVFDLNSADITPAQALTWGWYIKWCGVGQ